MRDHLVAIAALTVSACLGAGVGVLWTLPGQSAGAGSITGVESSARGPSDEPAEPQSQSRPVRIEGARGSQSAAEPEQNTIESVSDEHGSIRAIRGIEGIEMVMLQNLEAVLRMQDRSSEERAEGAVRAAAALLWTEGEPGELEEIPDNREEMTFELEGS